MIIYTKNFILLLLIFIIFLSIVYIDLTYYSTYNYASPKFVKLMVIIFVKYSDFELRMTHRLTWINEQSSFYLKKNNINCKLSYFFSIAQTPHINETYFWKQVIKQENNTYHDILYIEKVPEINDKLVKKLYETFIRIYKSYPDYDYFARVDSDTYPYWPYIMDSFDLFIPYTTFGRAMPLHFCNLTDPSLPNGMFPRQDWLHLNYSLFPGGELIIYSNDLIRYLVDNTNKLPMPEKSFFGDLWMPAWFSLNESIKFYAPLKYFGVDKYQHLWVHSHQLKNPIKYRECYYSDQGCNGELNNHWIHPRFSK
jgi:hypothetical protein